MSTLNNTTHGKASAMYAFFGNGIITILKFFGYIFSGSPSLFSESVHSFADTLNQGLLLIGLKSSKRKADKNFSYGYGTDRFFFATISACGIFFLGAGVTIYHGIETLLHPEVVEISFIIFGILIAAFVVEFTTLKKAYDELSSHYSGESFSFALKNGDPITVAVFYEDLIAVSGVFIASICIGLSYITQNSIYDSVGSLIIGTLLAVLAIILIKKNREFILGKTIPEDVKEEIIELLEDDKHIDKVLEFKSEILDIGKYHIKCEIEWNGTSLMDEIMKDNDLTEEWEEIDGDFEEFKKFVIYHTNRIPRLMGKRIDEIEKKIKTNFPQIEYIDLEIN